MSGLRLWFGKGRQMAAVVGGENGLERELKRRLDKREGGRCLRTRGIITVGRGS